jgi:hypothetical protein
MENTVFKRIAQAASAVVLAVAVTTSFAAAPWSPVQHHRHAQVHHLNHGIAHQERATQRAINHGHFWDAWFHANKAQQMANHKHAVQHQIHRSNRHWQHSHVHCNHHHLYC